MDGVLAFSPGEYFTPKNLITDSAQHIKIPAFITSSKKEKLSWQKIYEALPAKKVYFIPETAGNHGAKALWKKQPDSETYWKAVEAFLKQI